MWPLYGTNGSLGSCVDLGYLVRVGLFFHFVWVLTYCFRFVHERGYRTAIFNLGVLGGINLAVPIGKSIS